MGIVGTGPQYWDMEMEPLLNTPAIQDIQWAKLQTLLNRLYDSKPYWRKRMDAASARPQDITSLDEFRRRMPMMDKAQRRRLILDCDGDVMRAVEESIAAPADKVVLMAATSGTTGEPTPYPHTDLDLEVSAQLFARMLWRIGLRPGDRVVHAFGLSMWLAGVPYVQRMQKSGVCMLPVGAEGGSERILRFARQFRANTIFATPSLVEHLIEKAPEVLGVPVEELGLKTILCAGEPGAGIPEVRQRIESAYGASLYDHGGGYGISCDHSEYQGMHHIADDKLIFELVDPDSHEPLPFEHGASGLAVQTTLEAEGMLWMRETFGDIVQVFTDPCPCGLSGWRYKVVGRADDMLKVKGVMVYPAAIDGVITGFTPQVTGEFRIVLDGPPPRVVPPLVLKVEHGAEVEQSRLPALAGEIEKRMRQVLRITPRIEWVPPFSLPRTGGKTNFFDRRY